MRLFRWIAVGVLTAAAVVTAVTTVHARARDLEVRRIRAHFDSVLVELDAHTPASLTAAQRASRGKLAAELERYRDAGVFPHNYDFPDRPTPYFVDRKTGALCAVANLLAFSGRRDIVDRVAASNNNVWVAQLAGDTAFTAWLDRSGITLEEAARIQVPYVQTTSSAEVARNAAFIVVAPVAVATAFVTGVWNASGNADGHRTKVSKFGVVAGLGTAAAGALMLAKSNQTDAFYKVGAAAAVVGGASFGLATRSMLRHSAKVSPVVTAGNHPSAGIALSLNY